MIINNRYETLNVISATAMSAVIRARDISSGTEVALKFLSPAASRQLGDGLLAAEARRLRELRHDNLVHVNDIGRVNDLTGGQHRTAPICPLMPLRGQG